MIHGATVILFYMVFIFFLGYLVTLGAPMILTNAPAAPVMPSSSPGILDYLYFVFANIGFFISVLGMTSTQYPLLGVFILALNIVMLYMILMLIRGGG